MPPSIETHDGSGDAALLRAISENAECAHVLAAIAAGGDARQLIATLLPPEQDTSEEPVEAPSADCPATENTSEPAMYSTPGVVPKESNGDWPDFLSLQSDDFWQNF